MSEFWSDGYDYNKIVEKYPATWKEYSRKNFYTFIHDGKKRNLLDVINEYDVRSILDYGCGHFTFPEMIVAKREPPITVAKYDPFVEEYKERPSGTYDLVISHNVLSWVENEYVEAVIRDHLDYANKAVLMRIPLLKEYSAHHMCIVVALKNIQCKVKEYSVSSFVDLKQIQPMADAMNHNMLYIHLLLEK